MLPKIRRYKRKLATSFCSIVIACRTLFTFSCRPISRNYYDILEISENANYSEIKSSFFNLIKENHPDKIGETGKMYNPEIAKPPCIQLYLSCMFDVRVPTTNAPLQNLPSRLVKKRSKRHLYIDMWLMRNYTYFDQTYYQKSEIKK